MSSSTPLMKQYLDIKEQYADAILLFRVGDFYETFFDDAITISKDLGITLTKRNREKGQDIPLAGVPYHAVAQYIAKLIEKGHKIAICDQIENPKDANGLVKRAVTRVITPGTVIDTTYLDEKSNNYLLSFAYAKDGIGIAYTDITTLEFYALEITSEPKSHRTIDNLVTKLLAEIHKIAPAEIILDEESSKIFDFEEIKVKKSEVKREKHPSKVLLSHFNVISLDIFNIEGKEATLIACANLLNYVKEMQKGHDFAYEKIEFKSVETCMEMNITTQKNLDLYPQSRGENKSTLLSILDECKTSMASRKLKNILKYPLLDKAEIEKRYDSVEYFFQKPIVRSKLRDILAEIYDIERIATKLTLGTENARDFLALKTTLIRAIELVKLDKKVEEIVCLDIDTTKKLVNILEKTIDENAPFSVREGGMI